MLSKTPDLFLKAVRSVVGESSTLIALHEPSFDHDDWQCVQKVIESGWVSYQGSMVQNFEKALAEYLNEPYVISVVNGTSALFLALRGLDIAQNDEVLVPSITFAATANAVCHVGAIPHFVDVSEKTMGIDLEKLDSYLAFHSIFDDKGRLVNKNTGNPIKAIIPVYIFGAAFDIKQLQFIASKYNLQIIEDAAEALGSTYGDQRMSALTGIGILSFNGNKIITTGGGGAIVLKDETLALKIRHLSTTAKKPHRFEFDHDKIGYNMRLPALNAALGYSQLKKMDLFLAKKRELYARYVTCLNELNIGKMFDPDTYGKSNCWLNAFVLDQGQKTEKNTILEHLNDNGIAVRPLWRPLHLLDIYKSSPRSDCSNAENLYERLICLPSSPSLVKSDE